MSIDSLIALSTLGFEALKKFGAPSADFGDYTQKLVDNNFLTPPPPSQDMVEDTKAVSDFIGTAAQCHFLASWCHRGCPVVRAPYGENEGVPSFQGPLVFEAKHLDLVLDGTPVEWIYYSIIRSGSEDVLYRIALGRGMFTMDEVSPDWHLEGGDNEVGEIFVRAKKFLSSVSRLYDVQGFTYEKYPIKKSKARKLRDLYPHLPKLAKLS